MRVALAGHGADSTRSACVLLHRSALPILHPGCAASAHHWQPCLVLACQRRAACIVPRAGKRGALD